MAEEREVKESGYGIGIIVGVLVGIVLFLLTFQVLLLAK
jgi:tetrahydromethanopterin S-methyltransferase subunit G